MTRRSSIGISECQPSTPREVSPHSGAGVRRAETPPSSGSGVFVRWEQSPVPVASPQSSVQNQNVRRLGDDWDWGLATED